MAELQAVIPAQEQIIRRNRPGTKAEDMYNWPDQDVDEMDTVLAVQQHIQQLLRKDYTDIERILDLPPGQDEAVWKYEHLRQFCNELNGMAVRFQNECDPKVCTKMTATEQWVFLCAAHREPKECSALDYTLHALHGAASLLNSSKHFPSRVSIKENAIQRLSSIARRIYRIFSHAYCHHRALFDEFEKETRLCQRFTRYVTKYGLMSPENLIVPMGEGSEEEQAVDEKEEEEQAVDESSA